MTDIKSDVDAFLKDASDRRNCSSCKLHNISEINEAIQHFMKLKTSGATTIGLSTFRRLHLQVKFNYPLSDPAMIRHMRNCLGIT